MNDTTINTKSTATVILNYMMNRYMPFLCVAFLLFCTLGFDTWTPYAIIGFMWFATSYAFRCGVAHVMCGVEDTADVAIHDNSDEDELL